MSTSRFSDEQDWEEWKKKIQEDNDGGPYYKLVVDEHGEPMLDFGSKLDTSRYKIPKFKIDLRWCNKSEYMEGDSDHSSDDSEGDSDHSSDEEDGGDYGPEDSDMEDDEGKDSIGVVNPPNGLDHVVVPPVNKKDN